MCFSCSFVIQSGCPFSNDPFHEEAGTGAPPDGTFKNLATEKIEKRFNGGNIRDGMCACVKGETPCNRSVLVCVLPDRRVLG